MTFLDKTKSSYEIVGAEPLKVAFGDPMSDFIKRMEATNLVKDVKRYEIGSDKVQTIDLFTKDEGVFTIDLAKDGFHWVDFNMDEFLGKSPKDAAEKFKKLLHQGAYSMQLVKK